MPIPLLGLSLGDLGTVGSQAYAAKAAGEEEARRVQNEENERKRQRRRDALEQAMLELNLESEGVKLGRLKEGKAPVPAQSSTTFDPETSGVESLDEYLERIQTIGGVEAEVAGRISEARAAGTLRGDPTRGRRDDGNDPPSDTEVQRHARTLVSSYLTRVPGASVQEVEEGVPELIHSMEDSDEKEALKLLLEGGRLNSNVIRNAYREEFDPDAALAVTMDKLKKNIQELCQEGVPSDDILDALDADPEFTELVDEDIERFTQAQCDG